MKVKSPQEIRDWVVGLPNKLTAARIIAIPLLLILYPFDFYPIRVVCSFIFLTAAFTDFFDGYLARKYQLETPMGALLDPIADKMLIITGLILLVSDGSLPYAWIAILLICRDIGVSGMRLIALEKGFDLKVTSYGKLKTALQVAAIWCLMLKKPLFDFPFYTTGMLAIWGALGVSLYSGYCYWEAFLLQLNSDEPA